MITPDPSLLSYYNSVLMLADGRYFLGQGVGVKGEVLGELCFNTGMTGYQEILTDPSYAGQIITFTFPHIGNVGANSDDYESRDVFAKGLVIRDDITNPSNFRSQSHLNDWLEKHWLTGICGVDTRALTRYIRTNGAQNAIIHFSKNLEKTDFTELHQKVLAHPPLAGQEMARDVTTTKQYDWRKGLWNLGAGSEEQVDFKFNVVAIDFGEKLNILRLLSTYGCRVTVVPADTSAEDIIALNPDGVFLSNGPADPSATAAYSSQIIARLMLDNIPIFGICLGHQLIAHAVGASTTKMHQGHRGSNHPVKNLETGAVEITSQNHGFVVIEESLPKNAVVTHRSLFDGSVEGFRLTDKPIFCVQYHPESSPGPHDSRYLFDNFITMMSQHKLGIETRESAVA
jgi:carbamoyl-phosphate synthase small subunit